MRFLWIILLFSGANIYVFSRIWNMMPAGTVEKILLILLWLLLTAAPFLGIFAGGRFPSSVTAFLYRTGSSWLIIFLYMAMIFLLWDLLHLLRILPSMTAYRAAPFILGGILLIIFTGGYIRYRIKDRVELNISVTHPAPSGSADPGLRSPEAVSPEYDLPQYPIPEYGTLTSDSLKIVAISDLHLGYTIGKKELEQWIALINREEPDAVLIAGDIIDNNLKPLYEQNMAPSFRKIRSRYGVFAVPGNHEYIAGIEGSAEFIKSAGIVFLRDSVAKIDGRFYIAGRDDRSNRRRKPLGELLGKPDPSLPVILLDHQPYGLEQSAESGVDLQISGHTHRGQIWPVSRITDRIFEKSHGYLRKGDTHIYVSSGLGIWGGKFRIGTKSEYVVIHLKIIRDTTAPKKDLRIAENE